MADYEIREGQANLFAPKEKKSEKSPDFSNQMYVDGKLKEVALWENRDKNGKIFYGCKISDGKPREKKPYQPQQPAEKVDFKPDDGIPF